MADVITVDIPKTYGALLLGALFSAVLSGIVTVQVIAYYKLYPMDSRIIKLLVFGIWSLDLAHSGLIWRGIWEYLIDHYGDSAEIGAIPLPISLTIVCTAILTFFVHCFFAHRIFRLSVHNFYITIPVLVLATGRLISACVTSGEMIRLKTFHDFKAQFKWVFSLGLALSSSVDILVTVSLLVLLHNSRTHSTSLNHVVDTLILYTIEVGSLTCAATITSMVCWLAMNNNLIFMGLHFVIGKLYASSLLATLLSRHNLRRVHTVQMSGGSTHRVPVGFHARVPLSVSETSQIQLQSVQINIEKSIQYE